MEELKPCPFCGHKRSRLMHRTEYRMNEAGITAAFEEWDEMRGIPLWQREVDMLDFRHVFYRRCNKCGATSRKVRTDWHVRTQEEADDFSPYQDHRSKLCGFDADSDWARPWRDKANKEWNLRPNEFDRYELNKRIIKLSEEIEWYTTDDSIDWEDRIRKALGVEL